MTPNENNNVLWWITSIAISVVCCSVLFVLFASYLVDIKTSIREDNMRITAVEDREDRILANIEMMRKNMTPPQAITVPGSVPAAPGTEAAPAAGANGAAPSVPGASVVVPTGSGAPAPSTTVAPAAPATPAAPAAK